MNGVDWDCSKKVPERTIASVRCKPHYVGLNPVPTETRCFRGSWDRDFNQCVPGKNTYVHMDFNCILRIFFLECGVVVSRAQMLISGGTAVQEGDFPWHVGIYRRLQTSLQYICGGSIISEKLVLSGRANVIIHKFSRVMCIFFKFSCSMFHLSCREQIKSNIRILCSSWKIV